ncbi:hypothetical protein ACR80S_05575 [Halomonas sp. MA07-2]|uniref:hypothetical protein n=1 Tax=Halomonas sp. MA07-2 TaxID=3440841 RepID=UPI003EEAADBC
MALPFSGVDAVNFERFAWEWSQSSLSDIVTNIDVSRSYLISSITAIFYHFMGRDIVIPVFINGILGVLIFYFSLVLAKEVWGRSGFNKLFAVIVALHPVLNIHSAVVLRENYITIFVIAASIYLAKFAKNSSVYSAACFFVLVLISSFFHGGIILYAAGLPLFMIFGSSKIKGVTKILAGVAFAAVFAVIITTMDFGKLSDIQQGKLSVEYLAQLEANRQQANTAYLVGMTPSGIHDVVWQAPIKSFFLLAKPFPWDVRSFGHALLLLDAMLWWLIIFLIWKHRAAIKSNPAAFAILISCLITIVAFAYGTSNFGTGIRHRTKFVVMALALVSPFLPRVRFSLTSR